MGVSSAPSFFARLANLSQHPQGIIRFMPTMTALPPLSLYIHFPWCVRKCPYCDFNSHEKGTDFDESAYVQALIDDLEQELPRIWGRTITSVFMGGGTPSLFSPQSLDRLLGDLRARLNLAADTEISLEANPGTLEQGRFSEYRAIGINRLSIGVQSFHDDQLQALGRIHGRREAIRAAEAAHHAGFDNVNLDLMFALPGQNLARAEEDVQTAIDLEPAHISLYQLTLEPNTLFHHQPPSLPDEDLAWQMQTEGQRRLAQAGFDQYEISAYARTGRQCRHNLNYWQFGDYLGIGAGAHDKISDAQAGRISRQWKLKQPKAYLEAAGSARRIAGQRVLDTDDVMLEFMMNALRLKQGFTRELFEQQTGLDFILAEAPLRKAEHQGWIDMAAQHIRPTSQGQLFLNDLLGLFLSGAAGEQKAR